MYSAWQIHPYATNYARLCFSWATLHLPCPPLSFVRTLIVDIGIRIGAGIGSVQFAKKHRPMVHLWSRIVPSHTHTRDDPWSKRQNKHQHTTYISHHSQQKRRRQRKKKKARPEARLESGNHDIIGTLGDWDRTGEDRTGRKGERSDSCPSEQQQRNITNI